MKMKFIKFLPLVFLFLFTSCAINRAKSDKMLDERADYQNENEIEASLAAVDNPLLVPVRTEPMVADIWVHPHEMNNGDYFRGAWIRTVVTRSSWKLNEEKRPLILKTEKKQEVVKEKEKEKEKAKEKEKLSL